MLPVPFRSARALAAMIRRGTIGCRELLDLYVERIARFNPTLNAIVVLDPDNARKRARAADRALARGESWGPLHGVPFTVKESFDVAGMPTTWGVPALAGNIATRNALAVERLQAAGGVLVGKTNVPLMLADWQTFNAIHGTTSNPWDASRTPGGSSGGAAAALAAGLTGLEMGSDIGASIRNPAHYCGVYGHKPSFGICSGKGQALPGVVSASDIAVIGPMARSAADLALALGVVTGPDEIDGRGWRVRVPAPRGRQLSDFRVAVVFDDEEAEVDESVRARLRALAAALRKAKVRVREDARPAFSSREAHRNYIALLRAATSRRLTDEAVARNADALAALDPADQGYRAQMVRAQAMSHRDWLNLNEARHHMRLAWDRFFRDFDVLLCPVATTAAFPHDQHGERWERMIEVNGKPQPSTTQMFWAGYSGNCYLPSTVAPAGLTDAGLPVGVQIVGPQYGDLACIRFAALLEREFGGFVAPPGYD
jgi:amidase